MLIRKLFRTAWGYKAQFISMIIMITLGMGIFLGFNMEWRTIEVDTGRFFDDTNYADYRLYSEKGFTSDDLQRIAEIDGVDQATRYLSVNLDIKGEKNKALALDVSEDFNVSTFLVTDGAAYDENSDGFWLSDKFAAANDYAVGDSLTLEFQGVELSGEIVGLIKSGEHMICVADKNQLMPDYNSFGYAYITPKKLRAAVETKMKNTAADELKKSGIPEEFIDDSLSKLLFTDKDIDEAMDQVYAQINLLSDMDKEALEDAVKEKLSRTIMVTPKDDHVVYQEAMGEVPCHCHSDDGHDHASYRDQGEAADRNAQGSRLQEPQDPQTLYLLRLVHRTGRHGDRSAARTGNLQARDERGRHDGHLF